MMKEKIAKSWKTLPSAVRKTLAAVIGSTLIILGSLLVVLPGPFTLPLVILGLFVLGLEYAWARRTLEKVKEQGAKFNPLKLFKK
ncbi:PGPGW domain-containing protein [Candidatus Planktophila dulcis]|jgi:drug/metabolite transporter (DMT)-like permease|nr:PGPGW domain-containing protein [Candidatus Planktophila dulcis]